MGKGKQSPIAMMAASNFYRVLLERVFQRDEVMEDVAVPKTTVMLSQLSREERPDA